MFLAPNVINTYHGNSLKKHQRRVLDDDVQMNLPRLCSVGFVGSGQGYGQGYGSLIELPEARVWKRYRTHRSSGYCRAGVQNSHKFRTGTKNAVPVPRVSWHMAYRTHRSSVYGYECPTKLTEVPDTGMKVLKNLQKFRVLCLSRTYLLQKFRAGIKRLYPYPGYCVTVVQILQKFRVRV